jgi:hypothetical protein
MTKFIFKWLGFIVPAYIKVSTFKSATTKMETVYIAKLFDIGHVKKLVENYFRAGICPIFQLWFWGRNF